MKYIALIVAILSGWVIGQFLLEDTVGAYVSVLFSYHFFLAFLIAYMDWSGGFKLPFKQTVMVHTAVLIGLLFLCAAHALIPAFGIVVALVPGIAFLEVDWIFGKHGRQLAGETVPVAPYSASQEDYSEFLHYLKQPGRQFAKVGRPVQEEYGIWLAERIRLRSANQAAAGAARDSQAR